jgi:EAL and modified HD-GYP domain-containing signal transduction protein
MGAPFLTYQPLVTSVRKSAGTRLVFHDGGANRQGVVTALADVAAALPDSTGMVLLSIRRTEFLPLLADAPLPSNAVIEVAQAVTAQPPEKTILPQLARRSIPFCVVIENAQTPTPAWGMSGYVLHSSKSRQQSWPEGKARRILAPATHDEARAHFNNGGFACAGWPIPAVAAAKPVKGSSEQTILKLMQLIQQDADMVAMDKVLRQDPSLAYRLLRYINSSAFGLSVEIQSFQHAVMMLGLQRLQRWLSLLLMSASKNLEQMPIMRLALHRAMFLEKIGKEIDSDSNMDELFIVGAFSLLDRMMGIDFDEICSSVGLSGAVRDCLTRHGEPYGPLLTLAELCEGDNNGAALEEHAALLGLDAGSVNGALLSALHESQQLELG